MGITGLLPFLKQYQERIHLSEYKNKIIGIDGYVWLHRGVHSCALQVMTDPQCER